MPVKVVKGAPKLLESDKVLAALRKEHGDQIGGRGLKFKPVARIPTGIFPYDLATGGGLPRGRFAIFYGPESSGKSLNMYLAMRTVQLMGETAVLIDVEHAWDEMWGRLLGLDVDKLIIIQPDNAEQAVDAVEAMMYAEDVGLVGVDSVSMMITENEITSGAEKMIVAGSAAIVTKMVRKVSRALGARSKVGHYPSFLAISQTRYEIGKMHGDPEKLTGGNALRFASSLTTRFYGKNLMVEAVSKDRPTFKHVQGVVKKYRCPIIGIAFEFDQCILPHGNLKVGQVNAWHTVETYLKQQGQLVKAKDWMLFGQGYKTLDVAKVRYQNDPEFRMKCEQAVTAKATVINFLPETVKVDKETGELADV